MRLFRHRITEENVKQAIKHLWYLEVSPEDYHVLYGAVIYMFRGYIHLWFKGGFPKPLHQVLLGPRDSHVVDHFNGNKFDNRRCNIRHIPRVKSNQNRYHGKLSRGVRATKYGFEARVRTDGRSRSRTFKTRAAAEVYAELTRRICMPFAWRVNIEGAYDYCELQMRLFD